MRILYLSQWFEPEPVLKGAGFVRGLIERGNDVEVVTGFPNYPAGRTYPGYRIRLHRADEVDGLPIHRVALYPSHDRSTVRRMLNYLSFAFTATIFGIFRARRFDVLYAYPPISTALAAAMICLVRRRPYVMDIQDLWPDSVVKSGMSGTGWMERILTPLCNLAYRRAARIVTQSQGIADRLIERGVSREKIDVIYNWAHEEEPNGRCDLSAYRFEGRFNIVYGGNFGRAQGLETLIRAAAIAGRTVPELQLLLLGNGTERERLQALVQELGTDNVLVAPAVPRDQVSDVFAAADVLALHLIDDPLFAITIPHKTQSYMATGKPILIGVAGEAARLVTEAGAGIAVKPGDVEAMALAMQQLARTSAEDLALMGRRGRDAYHRDFTFAAGLDKTAATLEHACRASGPAARVLSE